MSRYSDDEPGSPWSWVLYLDRRDSQPQRVALEAIFSGRLGGDAERHFPWAWKTSELLAVRPVEFDVDHTQRRQIRVRPARHVDAHRMAKAGLVARCPDMIDVCP